MADQVTTLLGAITGETWERVEPEEPCPPTLRDTKPWWFATPEDIEFADCPCCNGAHPAQYPMASGRQ